MKDTSRKWKTVKEKCKNEERNVAILKKKKITVVGKI
jgi:hypothetical protein